MKITFYKYQGTGNDFIMIDDLAGGFPTWDSTLISFLCNRRFGIGGDGLILLQPHPKRDFYMKYYNSDGNESSMCGNGGRCIAAFARFLGLSGSTMTFEAVDGVHEAVVDGKFVQLRMKDVNLLERRNDDSFVLNTGSPHYVVVTGDDLHSFNLIKEARQIRYNDEFSEEGINVNFIRPVDENTLEIRTYERGVEDETLSCGTGVTAAALTFAAFRDYPSGKYLVKLRSEGGPLSVRFHYERGINLFTDIWLQGNAEQVFNGIIDTAVQK